MKIQKISRFFLLLEFLLIGSLLFCSRPVFGQQVTELAPLEASFRGVGVSPGGNLLLAGDSGLVEIYDTINGWNYGFFPKTITWHAALCQTDEDFAIAGSNGYVFCSTDEGKNWYGFTGTTATIRGLATNSGTDLFAVGDSGIILKSTNFGQSWSRLTSPVAKQLNAIAFGPSGKYGVAVGNDSAILVSTDSGASWNTEVMPYDLSRLGNSFAGCDFSAVTISPGEDSVWVGLERPVLPLLLVNGNADPRQQFTTIPHSGPLTGLTYLDIDTAFYLMASAPDDFIYIVDRGGMLKRDSLPYTLDADGNIDLAPMRFRSLGVAGSGTQTNLILAGDLLEVVSASFDGMGGASLQLINVPWHGYTADYLDADIKTSGEGYIVGAGGVIDRTDNNGLDRTYSDLANVTINTVWCPDAKTAVVCGWDGLILRTADSGATWQTIPSGTQERLHGIAFPTPNSGVIVGDFGTILRTTDTGNSWSPIANPVTTYLRTVAFSDDHTGIAAGDSGAVLRTTDTGLTWQPVNNILSGTNVSIRRVQGFPGGVFLAQAGSNILRSTDSGLDWSVLASPGDTIAMSFFNSQVGLIGSRTTSSALVPDTVSMAYTTNGGTSWTPFVVPIWNDNRLVIYWLDDHTAILNGTVGNVVEVQFAASGVTITPIVSQTGLSVYPNPASGEFRIDYTTKLSGPVQIELWDESGKRVEQLFRGEEGAGSHEQSFSIPQELHGAFFIRLSADGTLSISKLTIQ